MESHLQPIFEKETEVTEDKFVPTWLRDKNGFVIYERESLCKYDTSFGYFVPKNTISKYVESFEDMPKDEQEEFKIKLNK